MMIVHGFILLLLILVVPSNSLLCYECACYDTDLSQCGCDTISEEYTDYCVIFEDRYFDATYIQLTRIPRNSTWLYVEDPYYILVLESIRYNRTTMEWYLWTNGIIFGCDWDLCNSPLLINVLPNSFNLTIDTNWLDTNIYGNGSLTDCHHCPFEICGDIENPINFTQCPLTPCLNATTCLVYDLWNNIDTGDQCYQSQCAPAYLDGEFGEASGGKYRIDIEAIVYLARNRSQYDVWEIDVYCGAYNCSRPTIFQEIIQRLSNEISDLSAFPIVRPSTTQAPPTTSTPIPNPLTCYSCECFDTTICPCSTTVVTSLDYTYCVIVRYNFGQSVYIYSDYLDFVDTYINIIEFPYALTEESITYDEQAGVWYTTTNLVVYGCNWNLCNKPELIPLLPNSYQIRLPEAWLNSNVLGTGQPVRDCHQCPDPNTPQCGTTDFLDANVCPIQPCNTTCLVMDVYDDPNSDYLCYQSLCLPPDTVERHRIEIEGLVYASQPNVFEIWEVDVYCRADNCSRPGLFRELQEQLSVQVGTLAALFNETHDPTIPQRRCYNCYCDNQPNCPCEKITLMSANSTYCLIFRENYGQNVWVALEHVARNSTFVYIREFPYLIVEESILYSEQTGLWTTITNFVIYGCNWDYCNHPNLIPYLPNTFQMRLPETWLNSNVLGTGQPIRDCHQCPDAPQCGTSDFLDASRCPIRPCNTTCLVIDTFDDPANDLQCYQSFCSPPGSEDSQIHRQQVEIEGILYLHKQPREVELWEVDIYCRADDCSRPEIFNEIKSQLILEIGDLSVFDSEFSTTTQTTTTQTTTTQTTTIQTTTSNASIFTSINLFNILLISILLFNFY